MKFYNPFKWHVIEQFGQFWVRKLALHGWVYMSTDDSDWWRFASTYCAFHSLEDASVKLHEYPKLLKKHKDQQKIKVHV